MGMTRVPMVGADVGTTIIDAFFVMLTAQRPPFVVPGAVRRTLCIRSCNISKSVCLATKQNTNVQLSYRQSIMVRKCQEHHIVSGKCVGKLQQTPEFSLLSSALWAPCRLTLLDNLCSLCA